MKRRVQMILAIAMVCCLNVAVGGQTKFRDDIARETWQYVRQGSAAYLARDYRNAIRFYSQALELEKKEPTLPKNIWRAMVDNLGMSYGISGENEKARKIFEYGLSKDDTYPLFYYNLACAYAESKDLDNAIRNLKLAFQYRENMIPGEQMPDPATDDSFSRYLADAKFRQVLDEIRSKPIQKEKDAPITMTVPQAPWMLSLSGGKLTLDKQQIKPDGQQGYFLLIDKENGMIISLFIEPVVKCKTSPECRDMIWKAGNPAWKNLQNVELSELNGVSLVEFLLPEYQGKPIQQQNMYAEFVEDGYWVDLHLSKALYKPEDRIHFENLIRSVRFIRKGKL